MFLFLSPSRRRHTGDMASQITGDSTVCSGYCSCWDTKNKGISGPSYSTSNTDSFHAMMPSNWYGISHKTCKRFCHTLFCCVQIITHPSLMNVTILLISSSMVAAISVGNGLPCVLTRLRDYIKQCSIIVGCTIRNKFAENKNTYIC